MFNKTNFLIDTVILKVVAPCNLNCTYCYEYNMGDDSWKMKPKKISKEIVELICSRVQNYIDENNLKDFAITFHGGEPLMLSEKNLEEYLSVIKNKIKIKNLKIGMQTNATLATINKIKILNKYKVNIGVSVDGHKDANKYRVDLKGNPAHSKIIKGIDLIKKNVKFFSGFLSVVNLNSEPEDVLNFLSKYSPYQIDLLPPFGNYNNLPIPLNTKYNFGEWMVRAFNHWTSDKKLSSIKIRYLEDAMYSVIKGESRSDWFGLKPPGYIIVATDGKYEGLDTLKVANTDARLTDKSVFNNSIKETIQSEAILMRSGGATELPDDCKSCSIKNWCSGGYFPTRYSLERGYNNASYYCSDLKVLFKHISKWINKNEHEYRV